MPPCRILLLHNPGSRSGEAASEAVARTLRDAGVDVETFDCPGRQESIEHLKSVHGQFDAVVACGGDGTMNMAAQALAGADTPLGVIPAGTANDLARTLGLPLDPADAAQVIAAGRTRPIDLGEVNGTYFLNVASIGLSVALARTLTPGLKRRWGPLGYAIAAARVAFGVRPFRSAIAGEGWTARSRTYQIAVGNGRFYGGGMAVRDDAEIDDGRLVLYSLEVRSLWRLLLLLPAFRAGRHRPFREILTGEGAWFEVRTRRPRSVNADGEIVARTPARFRLHRSALHVFTP